jgi:hypothetical protein
MTERPTAASRPPVKNPWWTRPVIVLPGVAGLAFLAALFSPVQRTPRSGDPRLSTLSTAPLGVSLAHDLALRLGWRVERQMRAGMPSDSAAILAILNPAIPLRVTEVHALLTHVRNGGAAIVVLSPGGSPLSDSLKIRAGPAGSAVPVEPDSLRCDERGRGRAFMHLWYGATPQLLSLERFGAAPTELETFVWTTPSFPSITSPPRRPAMSGYRYGAGRLVLASDPDLFRNDALRDCEPGFDVALVRALEFLRDGGPSSAPRDLVVFDEYHQGHGAHPGTLRAAALYLRDHPSGRLLAQLAVAGIVLLLALAPRTVAPREDTRLERRSPVEQVDALARAYERVGATRTAAARLVRGLRRRTEQQRRGPGLGGSHRNTAPGDDEDTWLARVAARFPRLDDDVTLARLALARSLPTRTFATLGPALHRIETTLTGR